MAMKMSELNTEFNDETQHQQLSSPREEEDTLSSLKAAVTSFFLSGSGNNNGNNNNGCNNNNYINNNNNNHASSHSHPHHKSLDSPLQGLNIIHEPSSNIIFTRRPLSSNSMGSPNSLSMTPEPEKNNFPRNPNQHNSITVDTQSALDQASSIRHHQYQHDNLHHQDSELPTPPLSSNASITDPIFFPAGYSLSNNSSSVVERCEALESELSVLRSRLHRSEQSSAVRERRLSQAQQRSSNTQESLQTLKQQHEMTLIQLSKVQAEANSSRIRLEERESENQQLKSQVKTLASELREVTLDRDSLSLEMVECHADNAKFLKRLRISNDKVDRLQEENRYLIEQLRELRSRVADLSEKRTGLTETLDLERQQADKQKMEYEELLAKQKNENKELKELVTKLEKNQIQTNVEDSKLTTPAPPSPTQLQQLQQLQQYPLKFLDSAPPSNSNDILHQQLNDPPQPQHIPESFATGESTLTSIISSISSVASGGNFRRSKSIRQSRVVPSGVMIDI